MPSVIVREMNECSRKEQKMMESDGNDVNNQKGKSCTVRIERKRVLGKMKSSLLHDSIREFVQLAITVDGHKHWVDFLITNLGQEDVILGLPWLRKLNPEVDWTKGLLSIMTH